MSDITKCTGEKAGGVCPIRNACWRYKAPANPHRQSFFTEAPFTDKGCVHLYIRSTKLEAR